METISLVAMIHVESVPRSITFYAGLGFEVFNTFAPASEPEPTWASLRSGGAQLMLTRGEGTGALARQPVLFYLYCDDVLRARADLEARGVMCGEVCYPFYSPKGEFEVRDPDGYVLMVTHT